MNLLSDGEATKVIMNALCAAGDTGVAKHDLNALLDWAENATIDYHALQGILNGDVFVKWDGEPRFYHKDHCDEASIEYQKFLKR